MLLEFYMKNIRNYKTLNLVLFCTSLFFSYFCKKKYSMSFDIIIVGYIAGFCTAIAQFPQAYKVIKTGNTEAISPIMYLIMTLGILFWFLYGILIPDLPMILANGISLIPSLYILFILIRNLTRTNKQAL